MILHGGAQSRLRPHTVRRPAAPARSLWQNGYCERAIGSIRRDCLDHIIVFGEQHLRHLLRCYASHYNQSRIHLSLNKDAPLPRAVQAVGRILPRRVDCTVNMFGFDSR
jgi:hypothetical protein